MFRRLSVSEAFVRSWYLIWVPTSSDEGLWKRSKHQRFLVLFRLCNMDISRNIEFQPTICWNAMVIVIVTATTTTIIIIQAETRVTLLPEMLQGTVQRLTLYIHSYDRCDHTWSSAKDALNSSVFICRLNAMYDENCSGRTGTPL